VTSGVLVSSTVSLRYATALVNLAEEKKMVVKIEKDMLALADLLAGSQLFADFVALLTVSGAQRMAVMNEFASKLGLQTITRNFLGVLVDNGRLSALPVFIQAVFKEISKRRGEMVVAVQSAHDLSAAQQKALKQELDEMTGKNVLLDASINPDLLGGMIVTVGSKRIDSSVSGRLARLKAAMSRQVDNDINDNVVIKVKKEA
jgi:F-type H+-transporting ATPase subunit delta